MEIVFILVKAAVPENIGAAARALNTMGFSELRLVNPKNYPSEKAYWLAHGSSGILDQAKQFTSLAEALADVDFSVATSANKSRSARQDLIPAHELKKHILKKGSSVNRLGIVFGSEESGLSNADMKLCHLQSYIPIAKTFPSLNLSQAVMLYAYELSSFPAQAINPDKTKAQESEFKIMMQKATDALQYLGFNPGSNIYNRIMERLAQAGETDIHLILSFLAKIKN